MNDLYKTKILQVEGEMAWLEDIFRREQVHSYLEIGCKYGGSLWRLVRSLPKGSRVVAVDMPFGDQSNLPHLKQCLSDLCVIGYDCHLILGDSTDRKVVEQVRDFGPYDAVLIDANHLLPYVTKDWQNYGPMSRIVAFHDISWKMHPARRSKTPIEVPQFWASIKDKYRHDQIQLEPNDNGLGVLWTR